MSDVIVVGACLIVLLLAWRLLEPSGLDVIVFDRSATARGSSPQGAGLTSGTSTNVG